MCWESLITGIVRVTELAERELSPTRPLLRYHGGKWRLAEWIVSRFPKHKTYVEPYGGAASVLLRKPRVHSEIYNEADGEIVNLFEVVRDRGTELAAKLELTPFSRKEFMASYEPSTDPLEQARRTVVRSFMGFGSASACGAKTGFRKSSMRSGNGPASDWKNYPESLVAVVSRLRGVVIENSDALKIMVSHDAESTLHYVDPPYVFSSRKTANPYCKKGYRFEMTDEQHQELAAVLSGLTGMVVLSGYRTPLYDELFGEWHQEEQLAYANGNRPRTDVLWFNSRAAAALRVVKRGLF